MNKQQIKLIETVKELCGYSYKRGSRFCPERSCQLHGVETSKIDSVVGHEFSERRKLTQALNNLVDSGNLIKLVQNGQQTKWMTVE